MAQQSSALRRSGLDAAVIPLGRGARSSPSAARCGDCGTEIGEVRWSDAKRLHLCARCFDPGAAVVHPFAVSATHRAEPIEPETHRATVSLTGSGSKNGSMGIGGIDTTLSEKVATPAVDRTRALVRALGINETLGGVFECVLAGHEHGARVHPTPTGHWQYRCNTPIRSYGLAEVRAFVAYREIRAVSRVEAARWRERLGHEAGLLERREVPELPLGLSASARLAGEGWRLLVSLRDEQWGNEPFVFAREFVMAYCQLTNEQARRGVSELEDAGVIKRAEDKCGRAILWLPEGGN
jgi:hypothetical protein